MKKLLFTLLFCLFVVPAFAVKINADNYQRYIGKHFIFLKQRTVLGTHCRIGDKKFEKNKYVDKVLLIKDIDYKNKSLVLEETKDNGKTKTIKTKKIYPLDCVDILEDLDIARDFYIGKTLYPTSIFRGISRDNEKGYTTSYDAEKNKPYKIKDVKWGNYDSAAFKLMIDDDNYITAELPDQIPYSFTDINPLIKQRQADKKAQQEQQKYRDIVIKAYGANWSKSTLDKINKGEISVGMTKHQVEASWGVCLEDRKVESAYGVSVWCNYRQKGKTLNFVNDVLQIIADI
ncbi:hypothetical protein Emin_0988 [Elusimicrobium minutum Pei191]|uniref:Uncharacterized protein n=1 Tax=Elusimicrobium minutum (strain Pei191) TaxID=445932 RepID=B2KDE5_ELUMP|nr:hypothetical protein [Elusimicrobium minutum]ACC98541.1 hypothetical protein Emin_0988 [Elusimicrobium minutum Pei191]